MMLLLVFEINAATLVFPLMISLERLRKIEIKPAAVFTETVIETYIHPWLHFQPVTNTIIEYPFIHLSYVFHDGASPYPDNRTGFTPSIAPLHEHVPVFS